MKCDLSDFGLSVDLDILTNISINSFKSKVKKKAKEYAFYTFLEKQQSHSKLDNLSYSGLRLQKYLNLENMTNLEAQTVFSFRTRMSDYGENYRGVTGPSVCPLCHNHPDSQKWSYECKVINKNVLIKGRYSNIFSDNIENETVQTIIKITNNLEYPRDDLVVDDIGGHVEVLDDIGGNVEVLDDIGGNVEVDVVETGDPGVENVLGKRKRKPCFDLHKILRPAKKKSSTTNRFVPPRKISCEIKDCVFCSTPSCKNCDNCLKKESAYLGSAQTCQ